MKCFFVVIVVLLSRWTAAESGSFGDVSFADARAQADRSDLSSPPGQFVRTAYTTLSGPGFFRIDSCGTNEIFLKAIFQMGARLKTLLERHPGQPSPTSAQSRRLVAGICAIDGHYVDPLSAQKWDEIFRAMTALAQDQFGAHPVDWDELVDLMLKKAAAGLKDPHTVYDDPAEAAVNAADMTGQYAGIGVPLVADPRGARVDMVYRDSQAEKAGVEEGDVVVAVDDRPAAGRTIQEIARWIKGAPGTQVTLELLHAGARLKPLTISRAAVEPANVLGKMVAPRIGYVRISIFSNSAVPRFVTTVRTLREHGAVALVLDVRGNPGGRVSAVSSIVSEFLNDQDTIVSARHHDLLAWRNQTVGQGEFAEMPLAVLIDGASASASEILAAALRDLRHSVLVGARSYGKGSEQNVLLQDGGRALQITEDRWYGPAGENIDAQHDAKDGSERPGTGGIIPDEPVNIPDEQAAKILGDLNREMHGAPVSSPSPDPILEKAIELLGRNKT